jgi:MFS family permease
MLIHMNEGFGSFVISPYLPFMTEFWYGKNNPNTGLYVGLLVAVFQFGQFLSASLWGRARYHSIHPFIHDSLIYVHLLFYYYC